MGSLGLAVGMTLISGLAAQASNPATLMAVLSFPVLLPQTLLLIRIGRSATLDVLNTGDLGTLSLIILVLGALSVLLFPYLWRA
jgi:heme exporter protein B